MPNILALHRCRIPIHLRRGTSSRQDPSWTKPPQSLQLVDTQVIFAKVRNMLPPSDLTTPTYLRYEYRSSVPSASHEKSCDQGPERNWNLYYTDHPPCCITGCKQASALHFLSPAPRQTPTYQKWSSTALSHRMHVPTCAGERTAPITKSASTTITLAVIPKPSAVKRLDANLTLTDATHQTIRMTRITIPVTSTLLRARRMRMMFKQSLAVFL